MFRRNNNETFYALWNQNESLLELKICHVLTLSSNQENTKKKKNNKFNIIN